MTHSSRFNYKAKAKVNEEVVERTRTVADAFHVQQQAVERHLRHTTELQQQVLSLGEVTRACVDFLEENTEVGETAFKSCRIEADEQLPELTLPIITKRAVQVVNLMGQRLEVAVAELKKFESLMNNLLGLVQNSGASSQQIHKSMAAAFYIGRRPTTPELDSASEAVGRGEAYHRYNVSIPDDPDESDDEYEANGTAD